MTINPFDRYGIKEVADVTFYDIGSDGKPTRPVLFLDSLKTSTIEQTAENVSARGGKGNPEIITWDYGKEITVTLEDALFSAKSMAIMFGNGNVATSTTYIMRSEFFTPNKAVTVATNTTQLTAAGWKDNIISNNSKYTKENPKFYDATSTSNITGSLESGKRYICTYDITADMKVVEISSNTFPGTYYVTGDTYARSAATGNDEFFQFIIKKAKVTSENTITLEAEGDPSVFNLSLRVLRPDDGDVMMQLVQYTLSGGTAVTDTSDTADIIHNHILQTPTT